MRVEPFAWTRVNWDAVHRLIPNTKLFSDYAEGVGSSTDPDFMGEFAGRGCYKSWNRPNPKTNTTETYLAHIQEIKHPNVFEHASVTFYVQGVSRSLLLELERHRFLSFSVESQRYVDQTVSHPAGYGPAVPPAIRDGDQWLREELQEHYQESVQKYEAAVDTLVDRGHDRKTARGAARAFLPESTPTDFTVTANIRCWRDVIGMRIAPNADAEIREFAAEVLRHLREIAPYSVQDIEG